MSKPENTALWNAVVATDPNFVKPFSRGGGFKGTATNVVYLIRKATEQWGPMGCDWGVRIVKDEIVPGHIIGVVDGHPDREQIHKLQIELFYPAKAGVIGTVPGFGQTTFVGSNKNGKFTDEEAPKKSLTDALSKALSWLGFAADIHLGCYDDNKYVNDRQREFGNGKDAMAGDEPPPPAKQPPPKSAESIQWQGFYASLEELLKLSPEVWPSMDAVRVAVKEAATAHKIDAAKLKSATASELNMVLQSVKTVGNRRLEALQKAKPADSQEPPQGEFSEFAGTL